MAMVLSRLMISSRFYGMVVPMNYAKDPRFDGCINALPNGR
jgi:hypothetical protein